MRDINEIIRSKEAELQQLQRDFESLCVAVRMLADDGDTGRPSTPRSATFVDAYASTLRPTSAPANNDVTYAEPWDRAVKKLP